MRHILILGAGKSATVLIDYLLEHAAEQNWHVTVADLNAADALNKTQGRPNSSVSNLDLKNEEQVRSLISASDIVISMLPAALHIAIAAYCLKLHKHLVTPSYISEQMQNMHEEAETKGLVFMNEMGLDPGIDHMSALQLLDGLRNDGYEITAFKSHCGGLVAPECDNNPWHYKFSWNPRNVILAGQGEGGIQYKESGYLKVLNYEQLFASATKLQVAGQGSFESYPNRDSMKYVSAYRLESAETIYRGTLRVPPFCRGWQYLVSVGLTDDRSEIDVASGTTYRDFFKNWFAGKQVIVDTELADLADSIFNEDGFIPFEKATPAKILQSILEQKWKMNPEDTDMVVMVHQIGCRKPGHVRNVQSSFICKGKDAVHTAMAITVGLPLAIVTKMILNGQISRKGVLMPAYPEIYNPVLAELKQHGISFEESEISAGH